jgi:hypothetical protein
MVYGMVSEPLVVVVVFSLGMASLPEEFRSLGNVRHRIRND